MLSFMQNDTRNKDNKFSGSSALPEHLTRNQLPLFVAKNEIRYLQIMNTFVPFEELRKHLKEIVLFLKTN